MIVMILGLGAPLLLLIAYSFWTQLPPEQGIGVDTTPTFDRYAQVFSEPIYVDVFWRTMAISGLVTAFTVALGYPMAYYVAFHVQRYKFVWLILLTIPFWTSYLLRAFAWKIILGFNGVINSGLLSLGLITQPLEFLLYSPTAVVLTLSHAYAAFAILPIYVSLEKIDRSLLEASADLGDGPWASFWRVTLPLSMPGVIAAAVLIFVPVAGDYVTPSLVGGPEGQMIGTLIQVQFLRVGDWPFGAALALSAMAGVAILVILFTAATRLATRSIR
ncbi:MAG TPA: spermidine/putrescine ABC transporter [Alphaproteobacteria bacterium]|nr:spermidine/putrescine ABC transporter [Alphaproteobacteria bacterium]HAJ46624.1 spermidine/putrescine ABC transporter [Alphaproteobacteria bacterium]